MSVLGREPWLRGYKLCKDCSCPILKRGQKRKHPEDYRHAQGCRYARQRPGSRRPVEPKETPR